MGNANQKSGVIIEWLGLVGFALFLTFIQPTNLWAVVWTPGPLNTFTVTRTFTSTPRPPTPTFTKTLTPVPPTFTFTKTKTPIPPTFTYTFTKTNTPIPPTPTFTKTPLPPTFT